MWRRKKTGMTAVVAGVVLLAVFGAAVIYNVRTAVVPDRP
jgi:hypothetical protein